ncbi:M60 family peptidase N-terminal accessory domain-containing protein [Sphingobacterium kyonggiense]|uniref:M60 family peptidase N-terminal accessory domain-containing protein n=1 Tax=Sphingobacterium kyonggiense TaxID=714075 RepID=A0ABP7YQW2_9SPHI
MKKKNYLYSLLLITSLLGVSSCEKYGYFVPDGYPEYDGNTPGGVIDTNMKQIDKSMYAKARVFPGLVDQSEPRVQNAKFTLDLNFTKQTTQNLKINVAPEPQFSTGYYAAPGELIKIEVPEGIEGLTVQIGGHTDNLGGKYPLLRDPVIYMRQRLYAGANYVRNLYGGTIYIRADRAYANPVEFTITNAVVSPDFVLGQSTDADWVTKVKASKVPWLELRTKRVVFLIPRDRVIKTFSSQEPFTNPTAVLTKWNDVFDHDFNGWMGLSDDAADEKDRSPQGAWRGVLDIQLSAGYGHNGFPFVGLNDAEWFGAMTSLNSITSSRGMWGSYHEFGHNCQQPSVWSWSTLGETTNNLFNFKVANRIGADYKVMHPAVTSGFPQAIAYASTAGGSKNFDADAAMNDPFKRMTPFVQIFEKYGYGAMTHLYTEARHAPRGNPNDITKHNWVYEKLSDYAKVDLSPFFDAWGISYSDIVAQRVASKYPLLKKAIWEYNPLTKTGGDNDIVYKTSVTYVSCPAQEGSVANLVDGDPNTFYHSKYSNIGPTESYPFSFVLNAGANMPIKGIYFNARPGGNRQGDGKEFEVYYSRNNIDFTMVGAGVLPNNNSRFEYIFPNGNINAKYFKIIVKNGYTGNAYVVFGEMNLIKP